MNSNGKQRIRLRVWGDYACFTRPEMKVERFSYEVMTPSAARNILQAILWKPAIEWQIRQIDVLKPIRWISVRRNELSSVVPTGKVSQTANSGANDIFVYIEDQHERQQRAGLFLRDVEYVIHADFRLTARAGEGDSAVKFRESFSRRASRGQCFTQPYLGCREFAAFFDLVPIEESDPQTISETKPMGQMLYDLDYSNEKPTPIFFDARLENGKLAIPHANANEVLR